MSKKKIDSNKKIPVFLRANHDQRNRLEFIMKHYKKTTLQATFDMMIDIQFKNCN